MKPYSLYLENEEERLLQKQATCTHSRWNKQCAICRAILDSDHIHEEGDHEEVPI